MRKILSILLIACMLTGCGNNVAQDKYNIVASFYPVMLITKMATEGIDEIEVSSLASTDTGCLHDYALQPNDLKNLEKADLFVVNGLGMEAFLDKVVSQIPNLNSVDLSEGITPYNNNSHIWLTATNAKSMLNVISKKLSADLPQFSSQIEANKQKYSAMLDELEAEIKNTEFANVGVITCHEAFDYFAHQYNLTIDGTVQREPGEEPTTKELVETTDLIKAKGTKIILVEPQYSTTAAETISNETGAEIYSLDPIVTGEKEDMPQVYFDKMRQNTNTLINAIRKDGSK